MYPKKQTYQYGSLAEENAKHLLKLKGYEILHTRYKSKFGEIDIIAKIKQTIVFVEVKARNSSELIETILKPKQVARIKRSAQFFISQNLQYQKCEFRFDFILFEEEVEPKHFENYF